MSASLVLVFGVGSRFEEDRVGGISHFIEHLFFKGTGRRPTAKLIAEEIDGVGGVINASTGKELTDYWCRVPADKLDLAVDLLCDMVSDSRLAQPDIDLERDVILEELKMYLDQPQDHVYSLFDQIMWPDHPLGRDIIGTPESVASLTRDDLVAYTGCHYRLPSLVVGLAGAIDADGAADLLEKRLQLPGSRDGSSLHAPTTPDGPALLVHRKDTEQAHIVMGTPAISYHDPDRYALEILDCILGEGMSSRLFLEIRERLALAYDVHSFTRELRDGGYFAVYMGVDPKKSEQAVEAVQKELRLLTEELVPEPELVKAKESRKGRRRLGLEGTSSLASWLCHQELLLGDVLNIDEIAAEIDAITAEDLLRVARRVLSQPMRLAAIGPFPSDARFRQAI
jgi:predicted Zn-dependent peptidase